MYLTQTKLICVNIEVHERLMNLSDRDYICLCIKKF